MFRVSINNFSDLFSKKKQKNSSMQPTATNQNHFKTEYTIVVVHQFGIVLADERSQIKKKKTKKTWNMQHGTG